MADARAFAEDCGRATIVVSRLRAPASRRAPLVIDRTYLDRHGAVALHLNPSGPVTEVARDPLALRAWEKLRPEPKLRERAPAPPLPQPDPPSQDGDADL